MPFRQIDWEYPANPTEARAFVDLLAALRQGLDDLAEGKGRERGRYELTVCPFRAAHQSIPGRSSGRVIKYRWLKCVVVLGVLWAIGGFPGEYGGGEVVVAGDG